MYRYVGNSAPLRCAVQLLLVGFILILLAFCVVRFRLGDYRTYRFQDLFECTYPSCNWQIFDNRGLEQLVLVAI